MPTEQFTIQRWPSWSFLGAITVSIECDPLAPQPIKLGLAAQAAFDSGASLVGASLDGARLVGARLVGASLVGASLVGARLDGARLVGASLDGASLDGASLDGARLDGARLDGASLDGASLDGASLDGASLVGATIKGEKISRLLAVAGRQIDPYVFYAFELQDGGVKILAGCRWFSPAEFRDHVSEAYPDTDKATETLHILDFIEVRMASLGIAAPAKSEAA